MGSLGVDQCPRRWKAEPGRSAAPLFHNILDLVTYPSPSAIAEAGANVGGGRRLTGGVRGRVTSSVCGRLTSKRDKCGSGAKRSGIRVRPSAACALCRNPRADAPAPFPTRTETSVGLAPENRAGCRIDLTLN